MLSSALHANSKNLNYRPVSFSIPSGKAVFVDFTTAQYDITYNFPLKTATVTATINFNAAEEGYPIFDSVVAPTSIILDGKEVSATQTKTPSAETSVRVIDKSIQTGSHSVVIKTPLTSLVEFKQGGVKSAFWTSDLEDRNFLENYLPANLEYDQVKMIFNVSFIGMTGSQKIYTNGVVSKVSEKGNNVYKISYPDYYNASSIFFHTVPEGSTIEQNFKLKSIDGREIAAVVYVNKLFFTNTKNLEILKENATTVFQELESDYGAWPHAQLIIYNAGMGGMEYCGATMTSQSALGHEMFHSYFARAVMPANGNAGWLDEALASWRDEGYGSLSSFSGSSRMSGHPYYTRKTDTAAYTFGEKFMSYMDGKLKTKGGLKPFLRHMVDHKKFAPLVVDDFIHEMTQFYGIQVKSDFMRYTFGQNNIISPSKSKVHHKMSLQELKKYL
jgi:hypothetical protein